MSMARNNPYMFGAIVITLSVVVALVVFITLTNDYYVCLTALDGNTTLITVGRRYGTSEYMTISYSNVTGVNAIIVNESIERLASNIDNGLLIDGNKVSLIRIESSLGESSCNIVFIVKTG